MITFSDGRLAKLKPHLLTFHQEPGPPGGVGFGVGVAGSRVKRL
jgi:hypothetical protein